MALVVLLQELYFVMVPVLPWSLVHVVQWHVVKSEPRHHDHGLPCLPAQYIHTMTCRYDLVWASASWPACLPDTDMKLYMC